MIKQTNKHLLITLILCFSTSSLALASGKKTEMSGLRDDDMLSAAPRASTVEMGESETEKRNKAENALRKYAEENASIRKRNMVIEGAHNQLGVIFMDDISEETGKKILIPEIWCLEEEWKIIKKEAEENGYAEYLSWKNMEKDAFNFVHEQKKKEHLKKLAREITQVLDS